MIRPSCESVTNMAFCREKSNNNNNNNITYDPIVVV